jgi:hypothetical protein
MMKKTLILVAGLLAAAAAGFAAGYAFAPRGKGGWASQVFGVGLPPEFGREGGPLIEDLRTENHRLVIASAGKPIKLLGRHHLEGQLRLAVFDSNGKPLYMAGNAGGYENCRLDYSRFAKRNTLKFIYYTWDCRQAKPAAWKVEALVFRGEGPPDTSAHVTLAEEPGDAARIAHLLKQAEENFKLSRKGVADAAKSRAAYVICERSLNQVRNIGVGIPDQAVKALKALKWPKAAIAGAVSRYIEQLQEIRRIRAGASRRHSVPTNDEPHG